MVHSEQDDYKLKNSTKGATLAADSNKTMPHRTGVRGCWLKEKIAGTV